MTSEEEEELYLALVEVLKEMSQSSNRQEKLANKVVTLLHHHYDQYGLHHNQPEGEIKLQLEKS